MPQPTGTPQPQPTGDQIMAAARDAADEVFPNPGGATPGTRVNRLAKRLCQVVADPTAWDKK